MASFYYSNKTQPEKKGVNRNVGVEAVEFELTELRLKRKREKKATSSPDICTINVIPHLPI